MGVKNAVDSADTLQVKNFVYEINAFYTEIPDGRQKWREKDFCENSPVDSADTLRVRYFSEIALSHTVYEINVFLHFIQKFKMATKSGMKRIFGITHQ